MGVRSSAHLEKGELLRDLLVAQPLSSLPEYNRQARDMFDAHSNIATPSDTAVFVVGTETGCQYPLKSSGTPALYCRCQGRQKGDQISQTQVNAATRASHSCMRRWSEGGRYRWFSPEMYISQSANV